MESLSPHFFGCQLITSCQDGNFPGVRSAVSSGASLDYQIGLYTRTPASYCCARGYSEILHYLLDQGANAELADIGGSTPLHFTAMVNQYECAAVLLRHGVALDTINMYGETALWWASCEGHLPTVQLLVQAGADIDRACNDGRTPLAVARMSGRTTVVAYLEPAEVNWRRRGNYATMLNSIKGAPTDSKMMKAFQCHDMARVICSYI
jgi:ankyrin repeat protein